MKYFVFQLICLTVFALSSTILANDVAAQQPALFGGQGIRMPFAPTAPEQEPEKKSGLHWPKLSDFSTDDSDDKSRFRLFAPFGESKADSANELETSERPKLFGSMPTLFPPRDPSQPNLIDRMNAKSKDFVDRTTGWAQQKNQNLRARTFDTWDSITKDLRPAASLPDSTDDSIPLSRAQPPVRTAENIDEQHSVRF